MEKFLTPHTPAIIKAEATVGAPGQRGVSGITEPRRRAEKKMTEKAGKRAAASVPTGTVTFLFTDIEKPTSMGRDAL